MRSTVSVSSGSILTKPWRALRARLGDLEDLRLGLVEQHARVLAQRVVGGVGDLGADRGELAHDRALAHDLGVAPDVGGARRVLRERAEVGEAADVVELAARARGSRRR